MFNRSKVSDSCTYNTTELILAARKILKKRKKGRKLSATKKKIAICKDRVCALGKER